MPYNMHIVYKPNALNNASSFTPIDAGLIGSGSAAVAGQFVDMVAGTDYQTPVIGAWFCCFFGTADATGSPVYNLRCDQIWLNASGTREYLLQTTSATTLAAAGATGTLSTWVPIVANLGPQVPLSGSVGMRFRIGITSGTASTIATSRMHISLICV